MDQDDQVPKFEDFFNNDDNIISGIAELLAEAQEGLNSGDLNKREFEEIAKDILEIQNVDELASDLERKKKVSDIVEIFSSIVSSVI